MGPHLFPGWLGLEAGVSTHSFLLSVSWVRNRAKRMNVRQKPWTWLCSLTPGGGNLGCGEMVTRERVTKVRGSSQLTVHFSCPASKATL